MYANQLNGAGMNINSEALKNDIQSHLPPMNRGGYYSPISSYYFWNQRAPGQVVKPTWVDYYHTRYMMGPDMLKRVEEQRILEKRRQEQQQQNGNTGAPSQFFGSVKSMLSNVNVPMVMLAGAVGVLGILLVLRK